MCDRRSIPEAQVNSLIVFLCTCYVIRHDCGSRQSSIAPNSSIADWIAFKLRTSIEMCLYQAKSVITTANTASLHLIAVIFNAGLIYARNVTGNADFYCKLRNVQHSVNVIYYNKNIILSIANQILTKIRFWWPWVTGTRFYVSKYRIPKKNFIGYYLSLRGWIPIWLAYKEKKPCGDLASNNPLVVKAADESNTVVL